MKKLTNMDNSVTCMTYFQNYPDRKFCTKCQTSHRIFYNKNAQVWIETVLYTIIGLAIIGILLAFVMPKINQTKDNLVVEQSIDALKIIDKKIKEISSETGSRGKVDLKLKRGYLYIDSINDEINITIEDLSALYSESGISIQDGNVNITSQEGQKRNSIFLTVFYAENITYNGKDENKKINSAALPYVLVIENKGSNIDISIGG